MGGYRARVPLTWIDGCALVDNHTYGHPHLPPPQVYDRRKPSIVLACSVISLGAIMEQAAVQSACSTSTEVEITLTKGLHTRLDKGAAARLVSSAGMQGPPEREGAMGRGGNVAGGGGLGAKSASLGMRDIAEAGLLRSTKSGVQAGTGSSGIVQMGGGGIAVEGEEIDDFGIFSASGDVLSQADMEVQVGLVHCLGV